MVSTAIGLGVQGKLRLDREMQLIEEDMVRDQRLIARTLEPVLEAALEAEGLPAAESILEAAMASEHEIRLRVLPSATLGSEVLEEIGSRGLAVRVEDEGPKASLLTSYLPLRSPDRALVLQLEERSTAKSDFEAAAFREFLLTLTGLLGATTLIGAFAGYQLVGRRVERLIRSARAVSAGDFSVRPEDRGLDEVGTLSRAMAEMTRQLEEARTAAEAADDYRGELIQRMRHADRLGTLGTLASRFAHDIGTPLNVIHARAKMIERGEVDGAEARENAEIIAGQSERITDRVREVLRFARRKQETAERVDLVGLIEDTKTLLQSLARLHRVDLVTESLEPVVVSVFPLQLQQAVVNIAVNAIHASPPGAEVGLVADTVELTEANASTPPGRYARICVRDHGSGMDADVRKRVFEPFFTTKPSGTGTGLGLPIAAEIVRDHRGFIQVEDKRPSGTEFRVLIPIGAPDA